MRRRIEPDLEGLGILRGDFHRLVRLAVGGSRARILALGRRSASESRTRTLRDRHPESLAPRPPCSSRRAPPWSCPSSRRVCRPSRCCRCQDRANMRGVVQRGQVGPRLVPAAQTSTGDFAGLVPASLPCPTPLRRWPLSQHRSASRLYPGPERKCGVAAIIKAASAAMPRIHPFIGRLHKMSMVRIMPAGPAGAVLCAEAVRGGRRTSGPAALVQCVGLASPRRS